MPLLNIKDRLRKASLVLTPSDYKGKYLKIQLKGGLCNKLFCLFSACEIALDKECTLVEPHFGWNEKILFSDIYDIDYFNKVMSHYNNGKKIMVSQSDANNKEIKAYNNRIDLWEYSERKLEIERSECMIKRISTQLKVLKALRLRPEFKSLVEEYSDTEFTAVQVRTEPDWVRYAEKKTVTENETLLINLNTLVKMVTRFDIRDKLFFTSGDNHVEISEAFEKAGLLPFFFYNPSYEYEINAAINFEICCMSHSFIGLSRSSYSNLISLKRAAVLENDNSYIYNLNNEILQRIDKGLQPVAIDSVNKKTYIS